MRYLSSEWIDAANEAVAVVAATAPVERLIIDQHIAGASSYRVSIERDACSVTALAGDTEPEPDASFRQSAATAQALAQRTTDAHQAFLLGHITFEGNVDVLIARRDAFSWLEAALAPLMRRTQFD